MLLTTLCCSFLMMVAGRKTKEAGCAERASCGSVLSHDSILRNCGCDKSCLLIGDCCHDYEQPSLKPPLDQMTKVDCLPLPMVQGTYNHQLAMVRQCPDGFEDVLLKQRCESVLDALPFTPAKIAKDVLFFVPVVGMVSQLLYTNIYCAVCNKEHFSYFLNIDIRNRNRMTIKQLSNLRDLSKFDMAFPRSKVVLSHQCYKPRPCRATIKTCPEEWEDEETEKECEGSPASFVYGRLDTKPYRNKHCAYCNGITDDMLTCKDPRAFIGQASGLKLLPFSLLFDLNTGMVSARESQSDDEMLQTGFLSQRIQCAHGTLYDPFNQSCIPIPEVYDQGNETCASLLWKMKFSQQKAQRDGHFDDQLNTDLCQEQFPGFYRSVPMNSTNLKNGPSMYHNIIGNPDLFCGTRNASQNDSLTASQVVDLDTRLAKSAAYLTFVLNTLSIMGLLAQIVIYCMFPTLRNTPGKCLTCLSTALMISQVLFSFAVGVSTIRIICYAIAFILHFFLLTYFSWMSVLSFDIWHTFRVHARGLATVNNNNATLFCYYSFVAFGYPATIVGVSVALDAADSQVKPDYVKRDICWFGHSDGLFYLFVVPVAFTIAANAFFLILTIYNIIRASETTQMARASQSRREKSRFYLYLKLTLVMGVTWIVTFIAMATKRQEVWFVFIILNSLQGVWIFISFVCTRKVLRLITALLARKKQKLGSSSQFSLRSKTSASLPRHNGMEYINSSIGLERSSTLNSGQAMKWTAL